MNFSVFIFSPPDDESPLQQLSNNLNTTSCCLEETKTEESSILENQLKKTNNKKKTSTITVDEFILKQNIIEMQESQFKIFKLEELKKFAKQKNLHLSGTKDVLIKRIINFLIKEKKTIIIQKIFRGFIVRESFKLRGPAFKSFRDFLNISSSCVNETEPYSLEPINEIPFEKIITLEDSKHFNYVFDINCLIKAIKKNENLFNPYCREIIDDTKIKMIFKLYNILKIIFPNILWENDNKINKYSGKTKQRRRFLSEMNQQVLATTATNTFLQLNNIPENTAIPEVWNSNNEIENISHAIVLNTINNQLQERGENLINIQNFVIFSVNYNEQQQRIYNKLYNLQKETLQNRIRELFIEIDLLGNYTQHTWFQNLTTSEYRRYYHFLYDIWSYKANMTSDTKRKICSLYDPFQNTQHYPISIIKEVCVSVMENILYSGIDDEFRKIGALHILSALTFVSYNARMNMPWLYESYY